jgi:hypothetical protein
MTMRENGNHDEGFARVLSLLEEQRAAMLELDALAGQRRALIERDDPEGLLALLRASQGVIERLASATRRGATEYEDWTAGGPAEWRVREVRRRMEEIAAMHQRLARADEEDHREITRRRDALAAELGDLSRGRRAMGGYTGDQSEPPRFKDVEG